MKEYEGVSNLGLENVLITTGSQQALFLLPSVLVNQMSDPVPAFFVERPTYLGFLDALRHFETEIIEISRDENGMIIGDLERRLGTGAYDNSVVYLVSRFGNPTGVSLSNQRRKDLIRVSQEHKLKVLDDGPYDLLTYTSKTVDPLYPMDPSRVILIKTFSKMIYS